jgi:hypothetical protein
LICYVSGVHNSRLAEVAMTYDIGLLLTPDTAYAGAHYEKVMDLYPVWAADNGCFNHPNRKPEDLLSWLDRLPRKDALFFPAPDVVGDAKLTLDRSGPVLPQIRKRGFKAAFVAQNGIEKIQIPWDDFDCLFIGGDTTFKLSEQSQDLALEAKFRGKWLHMGRVNSYKRLKLANEWGCDSADGTYLRFTGPPGVEKILTWIKRLKGETCELSTCVEGSTNSLTTTQRIGEKQLNLPYREAVMLS